MSFIIYQYNFGDYKNNLNGYFTIFTVTKKVRKNMLLQLCIQYIICKNTGEKCNIYIYFTSLRLTPTPI